MLQILNFSLLSGRSSCRTEHVPLSQRGYESPGHTIISLFGGLRSMLVNVMLGAATIKHFPLARHGWPELERFLFAQQLSVWAKLNGSLTSIKMSPIIGSWHFLYIYLTYIEV